MEVGKDFQDIEGSEAFTLAGSMVSSDADFITGLAACVPLLINETEENVLVEANGRYIAGTTQQLCHLKIGKERHVVKLGKIKYL